MSTKPTVVDATPVTPNTRRIYPHVDAVTDFPTQQSLKLLWDRAHDLEQRLQAAEATSSTLVASQNATAVAVAAHTDQIAAVKAQTPTTATGAASGTGGAGTPGAPLPGEPGSQTTPIIAMSIDPTAIATAVRASLAFYGLPTTSDAYWVDHASSPAQFSNGKWYQGWNAYWEARAAPGNSGSSNPELGGLPSVHQ